jgi:hypothetical protein
MAYALYVLILFDSGLSDFLFCLAVFQRPNPKEDKVDARIGFSLDSSLQNRDRERLKAIISTVYRLLKAEQIRWEPYLANINLSCVFAECLSILKHRKMLKYIETPKDYELYI